MAFYKERTEIEVKLDENWVWVATPPQSMHYDGQVDYTTIVPKDTYNKLVDSESFFERYIYKRELGDYILLSIDSVDKNDELNVVTLDEFNKRINWNDIYISAYNKDDHHLTFVAQLVGLKNSRTILANNLNYKNIFNSDQKCHILEFAEPLSVEYLNTSTLLQYGIIFCTYGEKSKKIYYTLLSRYLKTLGIDFRNEFVDDSLDPDEEEKKLIEMREQNKAVLETIDAIIKRL